MDDKQENKKSFPYDETKYPSLAKLFGRPRGHDRLKIANDLIEWALKDDSLHLGDFCKDNYITSSKISEWASECKDFRRAYTFAKDVLSVRREQALKADKLHVKAYDLNVKVYDGFLRAETRDEIKFKAMIEAEAKQQTDEFSKKDFKDGLDRLMNHFSTDRSGSGRCDAASSASTTACKSNKTEYKS